MKSKQKKSPPKFVAIVPMRHNSERVRGKNYRPFAGIPLYHRIVTSLLNCEAISEIVIDTDSPDIRQDVRKNFPSIKLIDRPEPLCGGTVPMNDVLLYDVQHVQADFYLQTHSTNPLLQVDTISRAIRLFLDARPAYDSLFSVTRLQVRLWDSLTRAVNHNPSILLRTQDLPPVYEENSCLYIFTRKTLESMNNRIGQRPLMFEIDRREAWDIDEELDFSIAEFLFADNFEKKA
jgi:CMP-N-acetylneuraminic acid synthetase